MPRARHLPAALCLLLACASQRPAVINPAEVPAPGQSAGDFSPDVRDEAAWRALAASPGRQVAAHTEVVKVIIDLEDDWRVYFLQSRRWEIHYYFASRFLSSFTRPVEDHGAFNIREYRRPDRRFILGTLSRYRDQDVWAYELIAGDTLDLPRTARAFEAVRARVYFRDALKYHPIPPAHEAAVAQFEALHVPVVTTQTLFGATRFQPLNPGEAVGWLRFHAGEVDPARVRRNDVVVLEHVPLDLPACAGIVTGELQAPLGHVAVLATNRGTPNMALREGFQDARLRALEGRLVRLTVTPQDWTIAPATQAEADRAWAARRPATVMTPPRSLTRTDLVDVARLRYRDVESVGAKAAQLGVLGGVPGVTVPRGFAIPFSAYAAHFHASGAEALFEGLRHTEAFRNDPAARDAGLASIRERILRAPVDPRLLAEVGAKARRDFSTARVRFRSSTNAEDLPGFNGAGLYRSTVAPREGTPEALATALREVWASTWSFAAWEEREFFRIRQELVAMGVLVQESIDDDVVNGVAITGNPFNEGRPAIFLNAQVAGGDGGAVTSARGDEVPEQVLYYTYGEEGEFERLSRSSRTNGAPVLTDAEVMSLSVALRAIHRGLNDAVELGRDTPMDVEFLLAGPTRRPVFVQARPYPIRHDFDRGMAMPDAE
ncbi:MAG: PEP/pyruvate-binding domain-containing protein [Polyangiales bacterium]